MAVEKTEKTGIENEEDPYISRLQIHKLRTFIEKRSNNLVLDLNTHQILLFYGIFKGNDDKKYRCKLQPSSIDNFNAGFTLTISDINPSETGKRRRLKIVYTESHDPELSSQQTSVYFSTITETASGVSLIQPLPISERKPFARELCTRIDPEAAKLKFLPQKGNPKVPTEMILKQRAPSLFPYPSLKDFSDS